MRPLRTAATTAALRRTTQRVVLGGGRSSLIAQSSGSDRSRALLTAPCQNLCRPERASAVCDFLLTRQPAGCCIALERGAVGGRNRTLGRQRTGRRAAGYAVAADEGRNRRLILFLTHRKVLNSIR